MDSSWWPIGSTRRAWRKESPIQLFERIELVLDVFICAERLKVDRLEISLPDEAVDRCRARLHVLGGLLSAVQSGGQVGEVLRNAGHRLVDPYLSLGGAETGPD